MSWEELEKSLEAEDRWRTYELLASWPRTSVARAKDLAKDRGYICPKPPLRLGAWFVEKGCQFESYFHKQTIIGILFSELSFYVAEMISHKIFDMSLYVKGKIESNNINSFLLYKTSDFLDAVDRKLMPTHISCHRRRWFPKIPTFLGAIYIALSWIFKIIGYLLGERCFRPQKMTIEINLFRVR